METQVHKYKVEEPRKLSSWTHQHRTHHPLERERDDQHQLRRKTQQTHQTVQKLEYRPQQKTTQQRRKQRKITIELTKIRLIYPPPVNSIRSISLSQTE